ncbi:HD-GYP domain [Alteromonadaceae bacterium Bs31]|nr:HD-GYP domain [Alteromonadaceae bacterium Bs31]
MQDPINSANENYLQHLISLPSACSIRVEKDILLASRECLFAAGKELDLQALYRLRGKTLIQPLSLNLSIAEAFDAASLTASVESYLQADPVLLELFEQSDIKPLVRQGCGMVCDYSSLRQCLWLMQKCYPNEFERGLFCAVFTAALYRRKGYEDKNIINAFFAALVHDIAYLFIKPLSQRSNEELKPQEWQQLCLHPELAYELLSFLPLLPSTISRAVLEHHEEVDGSGYPSGKLAKQLAPLGRMIHLLDSVHAIYTTHFRPRARTLHDLVPIVQMNQMSRPGMPAADLISFLRLGSVTSSCSVPEELMPLFITQVKERHSYIRDFVQQAETFIEQNQMSIANAKLFALSRMLDHICVSMNQSGLINDAYMRWLDQVMVHKLDHAYREVEDAFLMMQEVLYHIQGFILRMQSIVEEQNPPVTNLTPIWAPDRSLSLIEGSASVVGAHESTKKALENFERKSVPPLPGELKNLWVSKVRKIGP